MVVSVRYKLGKALSRFASGSFLGDSLLVRARTTSFAVLGASAAIGLAVLAIALQEDWPLVPGSPPPQPLARHAALGEATAVAVAKAPAGAVASGGGGSNGNAGGASRGGQAPHAGNPADAAPSTGSVTAPTSEAVVSPSVQAPEPRSRGGGRGPHLPRNPTPSQPPPKPKPAPQPAPAPAPPASPAPPPPPAATVSATPPEQSSVPPWSNGQGHAYGREDGGHGHGD
jgi:hypothetical protein